jgi:hypothetical protein
VGKCREADLPTVPRVVYDQDTRWNNKYKQYETISSNWEKFVANNVLNHEQGKAFLAFFQEVLEPLMIWTRVCECESANAFDALNAYIFAAPLLVLHVPPSIVGSRLRHFFYPGVIAAATLQPTFCIHLASPMIVKFLRANMMEIVTDVVKKRWDEDEWLRYTSFEQQRAFIQRVNKENTVNMFYKTNADEFPCLFAVFELLWSMPASSADVERVFKSHARFSNDRPRLSHAACESQLVIQTFSSASEAREVPHHVKVADGDHVEKFLDTVSPLWKARAAESLTAGMVVDTFWLKEQSRVRWETWKATLISQNPDNTWKVKWKGRPGRGNADGTTSTECFSPLVDDWLVTATRKD